MIETPKEMLQRVARVVASVEEDKEFWAGVFYAMMARLDFLPNSPTLMNAGRPSPHGQLSACYVVGVEDSMDSIFSALRKQAIIHKSGGGTGFNFSNIRPANARVNSTNGKASGPVSFMEMFNLATDVVQQGGMRRGANMGILNCDHDDVIAFIRAKTEEGKLNNFNISVAVTDKFMETVLCHKDSYEAVVFDEIVRKAWATGDPGLIFIDEINNKNTTPHLGKLEATNPCGETPLYPDEACNLGSINLANFVHDRDIDWTRLVSTVHMAVRFLDNVIDVNQYPFPEIEKKVKQTRKIGLGVMGWAEMLFQLGIPYDSQEAIGMAMDVMEFIQSESWEASRELAKLKGQYPAYSPKGQKHDIPLRNATRTCIAPTGTLSLLADCSSGIEPVFALEHVRKAFMNDGKDAVELRFKNKYFEQAIEEGYYRPAVFKTSHEISPYYHIRHQAAFQKYTDLAVSKTVNLPHNATMEDVRDVFMQAWSMRCKGVTVYRDRCKPVQVLYAKDENVCPVCGEDLSHKEGCVSCEACGWSRCSI